MFFYPKFVFMGIALQVCSFVLTGSGPPQTVSTKHEVVQNLFL